MQKEAHWNGVIQPDSQWAFADQGSFKMTLRKVHKNIEDSEVQAKELQTIISEKFSDEVLYELFCNVFYNKEEQKQLENDIESLLEDLL